MVTSWQKPKVYHYIIFFFLSDGQLTLRVFTNKVYSNILTVFWYELVVFILFVGWKRNMPVSHPHALLLLIILMHNMCIFILPTTLSNSSWHLAWQSWCAVMKHTNQSSVIRVVSIPAALKKKGFILYVLNFHVQVEVHNGVPTENMQRSTNVKKWTI